MVSIMSSQSLIPTTYDRLDTVGCIGCEAEGVWESASIDRQQVSFCESDLSGYTYKTCMRSKSGNGEWSSFVASECASIENNPILKDGEAYYRGTILVDDGEWMRDRSRWIRRYSRVRSTRT